MFGKGNQCVCRKVKKVSKGVNHTPRPSDRPFEGRTCRVRLFFVVSERPIRSDGGAAEAAQPRSKSPNRRTPPLMKSPVGNGLSMETLAQVPEGITSALGIELGRSLEICVSGSLFVTLKLFLVIQEVS